jgi:nucleotide-binding universal stress UspA family protein
VHSWSDTDLFVDRSSYEQQLARADSHERLLAEALAGFAEKYPDVAVTRHIPDTSPIGSLVAMSHEAAMVVVGSRGLTGVHAVLGSVSRDVVERAACTVVVARS